MPAYSGLLIEERDRIGVVRAAGRLIGAIAKARQPSLPRASVGQKLKLVL